MKRQLLFRQIYYDARLVQARRTQFFIDSKEQHESVTKIHEDSLVKWLFSNDRFPMLLCQELHIDLENMLFFVGVKDPITTNGKKPGDIDILIVDKLAPCKSIAIECKVVKSESIGQGKAKVNKISKIRRGIIQANKYQGLGFYQSYFMVIISEDGRHEETKNIMMRSPQEKETEVIYDIPQNERMHEDLGVIYVSISQPTGRSFNLTGGIGVCIDKNANKLEQTIGLTNKIKDVCKSGVYKSFNFR